MVVDVTNRQRKEKISKKELDFIHEVMQKAGLLLGLDEKCEVSIAIVSDRKIRELNRDYRNKNFVTDVLSFALEEAEEPYGEVKFCDIRTLGDIVISISKVIEQAAEYGHSRERELGYLVVHGLLHLVGYDHECKQEKLKMRKKEEEVLKAVGVSR